MSEAETKGFKVVDKRAMSDEEREQSSPSSPPAAAPPKDSGNPAGPSVVEEGKSPGPAEGRIGGPTFLDLVMTLQMGTMVNLGMVQSGDGRRSPVNLPAAKDSIDILEILKDKTKGNLTEEEAGVLSEGLYHLRMAYVAAMNAGPGGGGQVK